MRAGVKPLQMCRRLNMFCSYEELAEGNWASTMIYRVACPVPLTPPVDIYAGTLPSPYFYLDLPPKAMVRAKRLTQVTQGNHSAKLRGGFAFSQDSSIEIFHFPIRSPAQFEKKIVQGGQAYAANREFPESVGWHWRRWYQAYCQQGLDAPLSDALPSNEQLNHDLQANFVIQDLRFQNLLTETGLRGVL